MFKSEFFFTKMCRLYRNYSTKCSQTTITNVFETKKQGDLIEIKGWVKSIRKMKENIFFDVNDGSCSKHLQVIIPQSLNSPNLSTGSSVIANGNLNLTPKGQLELSASKLEILGTCILSDGYPFAPRKSYPSEYIRQYLHFRPRTNKFASLLRIRDVVSLEIHNHLNSKGYTNIHTPILTSNDCEGAGEVFTVSPENKEVLKSMTKPGIPSVEAYFDRKVFLTVSGQLHLEAAAHGLSKVYTFGPTFRAENSRSRLHLSEFYMLEAEIAFVYSIEEICKEIEILIRNLTQKVLDKCPDDLNRCQNGQFDLSWISKSFTILRYDEVISILNQYRDKFSGPFIASEGLSKEHEIFLVKHCGDIPVFVINWPKSTKPFYMKECPDDSSKVSALDLLGPNVGEIAGGSLRENDYNLLKNKLPKGFSNFDWYLDLRKFGSVPTGGFGLGFERYLQMILGIGNIKDTIPFPRWPHNCNL